MKLLITLSILTLIASCGSKGSGVGPVNPVPASLSGGTWIALTNQGDTRELVFDTDKVTATSIRAGYPINTVTVYRTAPWATNSFLAYQANTAETFKYWDIQSNMATLCVPDCSVYTR